MLSGSAAPDATSTARSASLSASVAMNAPDDTVTPVGIVIAAIFGSLLLFSGCAILYFKLRAIYRLRKKTRDQEALMATSEKPFAEVRPMSYMVFSEKRFSDEDYVSQSASPASSRPQSQESVYSPISLPSTTETYPRVSAGEHSLVPEMAQPRKSVRFSGEGYSLQPPPPPPARRSLLQQALLSNQRDQRRASPPHLTNDVSARSPPAPISRYASPRTPAPAPRLPINIAPHSPSPANARVHHISPPPRTASPRGKISPFPTTPSPPRSPSALLPASPSPHASLLKEHPMPAKPNLLHLPHRPAANRPRKPSGGEQHRSLSPDSSAVSLLNHPAVMGRRLGDVSPGTDPEYPYPMTPQQIGDGRPPRRELATTGGVDRGTGENRGRSFREGCLP